MVAEVVMLQMANKRDLSCDVLDSRAHRRFISAIERWLDSLPVDSQSKAQWRDSIENVPRNPTEDCAIDMADIPLWRYRDPMSGEPQPQFAFLMKAKDFELQCEGSALTAAEQLEFFKAGLAWIEITAANQANRKTIIAKWLQTEPSEHIDCSEAWLPNFMVTWSFQGATRGP
jgi:hypothetical protein